MKRLVMLVMVLVSGMAAWGQQPAAKATIVPIPGSFSKSACMGDIDLNTYITPAITVSTAFYGANIKAQFSGGQSQTPNCAPGYTATSDELPLPKVSVVQGSGLLTGLWIRNLMPSSACAPDGAATDPGAYKYLCLYDSQSSKLLIAGLSYQFDTKLYALTLKSADEGDSQVTLNIVDRKAPSRMSTTSLHYQVCYAKGQLDHSPADLSPSIDCLEDGLKSILLPITSQSPVVGSLDNDFTYGFKVRVVDNSNPKTVIVLTDTWSNIQTAVPFQIDSIAVLDNSGPNWAMDCSQGSTSPSAFAIWAFLGVILLAMRKRSSVFLLVALLTTPSFARFGQVSIGITGSPYRPNLNLSKTEKSGVTNPWYKCIFDDKLLPLMGLHVDMHLFDNFGSLRVGLGAAYAYASGFGVKHGSCDNKSGQSTAGVKTNVVAGMHMLHLRPQLTYVLDTWIDSFPVAPYVKAGLVGAGYYDTFQNKPDNPKALGMIFGWEAAAGLMLALDWIEPTVSGEARGLGTYDHTFLVFEAAYAPIDNFGNNGRNYSNAWLSKTVPLSLTASLVVEFQ